MNKINDGEPAFPVFAFDAMKNGIICYDKGMTLRDYFAGQALAGMDILIGVDDYGILIRSAYKIADAMIKQRSVENEIN